MDQKKVSLLPTKAFVKVTPSLHSSLFWLLMYCLDHFYRKKLMVLQGIKIARNCPPISHLMFVDDLVVFSRANQEDLQAIQSCLSQFQTWSRLSINMRKSTITFSKNVPNSSKTNLCTLFGLHHSTSKNLYLGLSTHIQRSHQAQFSTILEKISSRISGWKAKILSQAAKATLIKNVLSSIPSYWTSSFKLPKSICSQIDARLRDFF